MSHTNGGRAVRRAALLPLVVVTLGAPAALLGQENIASDRPGIGSGAFVLGPGVVQLETGIQTADAGGSSVHSVGQLLVRIGFSSLELELFGNSLVFRDTAAPTADDWGIQDAGVGVKVPLVRDDGPARISVQAVVSAPTGSTGFSTEEWTGGVNGLADFALGESAGVSVNAGVGRVARDGAPTVKNVIITPGVSLTDVVGAYGGWAGTFVGGMSAHILEAGLTFLASSEMQLDVNGGWSTDQPGDNWFVGVGFATRWGAR